VLCGGSECAQQVTMLGLDPALARGPLYTELLPALIEEAGAGVPYVPNAPWGGALPFHPGAGVANYYGVGAYRRPLADARLAEVRFAAECLAFSNVPDPAALELIAGEHASGVPVAHLPVWKAGIPRDTGAGWDFEDVRDHYLREVYGEDPLEVRWSDPARYLELGRAVTGEVMADVFGEWRRSGSACGGGLVLWLRDLRHGAGWGLIDSRGRPKAALHHLRRALAPVAVWLTDEGLAGIAAHVANDREAPLEASLRVALYRDGEVLVEQERLAVRLSGHGIESYDVESILGRFVDVGWAYRFGPPGHDLVVASLETGSEPGAGLISQAFRFPIARPLRRERVAALGLEARVERAGEHRARLLVSSRRVVHGLRVEAAGWIPDDDALTLEPGVTRELRLTAVPAGAEAAAEVAAPRVILTALNLADRLTATSG